MPAAGWAPRPLCGKCFHWKTSPPTECLQTQLFSSKAASTTDWDPFLMQIHIILLGNSRCSAMLSFRKIRTLLSPPPSCTWLPVSFNRSHPRRTLGCLLGCEVQIQCYSLPIRKYDFYYTRQKLQGKCRSRARRLLLAW